MAVTVAPEESSGKRLSGPGAPTSAPLASAGERTTSYDVEAFPPPHGREEEWRFTPLKRMSRLIDGAASGAHLKWRTDLPDGVEVVDVTADDPVLREVLKPVDRISALAYAHAGGATVIRVPKHASPETPVVVELAGESADDVVWGHIVLDIGEFADVTVVIDHTGSATYGGMLSMLVGDGARLTLVSVQDWADDAVHVEQQSARLGRDSRLMHAVVTLGGDLVRLSPIVRYAGTGGDAELLGLYFADAGQHLEHRLFVDHDTPHCKSRVAYKGALQGQSAHTVWIGDVLIRAAAIGTDTYELNRNLLLTDGARADSVPNLEIETGEVVGAGHASATGRFDDEQLFYLMARGIPEADARRLVVRGFFAEIVERIGVESVRTRLLAAVDDELSRAS
jgi:Fe-S cluster assembly protein SufD